MSADERTRALSAFPNLPTKALADLPPPNDRAIRHVGADFDLTVILGDARTALPRWDGQADAWFLDGFSPAKNPELWGADLLAEVGRHTAKGGTFATYTAAGFVRRALDAAGFDVSRTPGFGRKRHMSRGVLR